MELRFPDGITMHAYHCPIYRRMIINKWDDFIKRNPEHWISGHVRYARRLLVLRLKSGGGIDVSEYKGET